MTLTDQELQRLAQRRVKQKMGFFIHATVFLLVNLGLAAINFASGGKASLWPLAGWGLGLTFHGFVTFANRNGDGLRERMLKGEVERLRRQHSC